MAPPAPDSTVRFTVYSDVLCPWCYNGAVRLRKLKQEYGDRLEITWKSFLLRPYPETKSFESFKRYTQSWERPASQADAGEFRVWSTQEPPPSHSVPPNVAVKAAAEQDAFERYHIPLMRAYFYENRNITNATALIEVAREQGLDVDRFIAALRNEAVGKAVARDHAEAVEVGVTGVPCLVLGGVVPIPGAQDLAFYRHLVDKGLRADRQR